MKNLGVAVPEPIVTVKLADIRRKYHKAVDKGKSAASKRRERTRPVRKRNLHHG